jgi:hypothetical protein
LVPSVNAIKPFSTQFIAISAFNRGVFNRDYADSGENYADKKFYKMGSNQQ